MIGKDFKQLKAAHPRMKWTTGEHEYTRYGFRQLISGRHIDILQPDVMWAGGLTELLRICAMASAYDIPVVPHCSGPYSNHLVISQPNCPFSEFLITSLRGEEVRPLFGNLFEGEILPRERLDWRLGGTRLGVESSPRSRRTAATPCCRSRFMSE